MYVFTLKKKINAGIFDKVINKLTTASENKINRIPLNSSDTRMHHKMALRPHEPPRIKRLLLVSNPVCGHAVEVITQPRLSE